MCHRGKELDCLPLNNSKIEMVHITSRFSKDTSSIFTMKIRQAEVTAVDEAPDLGVFMDKNMTLTTHVKNLCHSGYLAKIEQYASLLIEQLQNVSCVLSSLRHF